MAVTINASMGTNGPIAPPAEMCPFVLCAHTASLFLWMLDIIKFDSAEMIFFVNDVNKVYHESYLRAALYAPSRAENSENRYSKRISAPRKVLEYEKKYAKKKI